MSPIDGYVLARNVSPGRRFEKDTEFYRIADLSHVWIVAELFGGEDQHLRPGALASITRQNQSHQVPGSRRRQPAAGRSADTPR